MGGMRDDSKDQKSLITCDPDGVGFPISAVRRSDVRETDDGARGFRDARDAPSVASDHGSVVTPVDVHVALRVQHGRYSPIFAT